MSRTLSQTGTASWRASRRASEPSCSSHPGFWASALTFANTLFQGSGYAGQRKTIDIWGDGPNTAGTSVVSARDSVLAHGVTINGLPILIKMGWSSGLYSTAGLDLYYEDCVIGGPEPSLLPSGARRCLRKRSGAS